MWSWVSRAFKAPYAGLKIQRHMAPLTTVGKAHGRITMDLSSHRPLNSALSSNPSSMPSTTSRQVVEGEVGGAQYRSPELRSLQGLHVVPETHEGVTPRGTRC